LGGTTLQDRKPRPGQLLLNRSIPAATIEALKKKGYQIKTEERTSGPINAILFDKRHRTLWGGSSNHGEDYGIAW
jgi:gamma-glutamyltranspeptidase/glutathione hydrolase